MIQSAFRMAVVLTSVGISWAGVKSAPENLGANFGKSPSTTLPVKVDHRPRQSPVKDQGDRPTCLAHAVVACLEAQPGMPPDLSEEMLHDGFAAINEAGNPDFDREIDGIHIATMENYHRKFLIGEEETFTYSPKGQSDGAMQSAYEAADVRIATVERIRRPTIQQLEELLAAGHDVVIDAVADYRVESIPPDGVIDLAPKTEHDISHFMLVVGYDRDRGVMIVKNSFGTSNGDQGYNYLTYRFVEARVLNAMLIWGERELTKVTPKE